MSLVYWYHNFWFNCLYINIFTALFITVEGAFIELLVNIFKFFLICITLSHLCCCCSSLTGKQLHHLNYLHLRVDFAMTSLVDTPTYIAHFYTLFFKINLTLSCISALLSLFEIRFKTVVFVIERGLLLMLLF